MSCKEVMLCNFCNFHEPKKKHVLISSLYIPALMLKHSTSGTWYFQFNQITIRRNELICFPFLQVCRLSFVYSWIRYIFFSILFFHLSSNVTFPLFILSYLPFFIPISCLYLTHLSQFSAFLIFTLSLSIFLPLAPLLIN